MTGLVTLDAYVDLYQVCLAWPFDYIMIEALMDVRRLRIRSGVLGSAPISLSIAHRARMQ